jgi:hypothetical protein
VEDQSMRWEVDGGYSVSIEELAMFYKFNIELDLAHLVPSHPGYANSCPTGYVSDLDQLSSALHQPL